MCCGFPLLYTAFNEELTVSATLLQALSNIVLLKWVSVLNENKVYLLQ